MGVKIVNLTPHNLTLIVGDKRIEVPASGIVARVSSTATVVEELVLDDKTKVPVVRTEFGKVEGLPEPEPGTIYVASSLVAQAVARLRTDVVAPDTSPAGAVRDSNGQIIGVTRLQRF